MYKIENVTYVCLACSVVNRLNKSQLYKSFHLRELIELSWQVISSPQTPFTSRARKMQHRKAIEICF